MAQRVIWSRAAVDDLQSIAEYIKRDSARYAAAVVDKIITLTHKLPDFPFQGRIVPEFEREDIRERFVFSYRVIYCVRNDAIVIVNIIHGRRQFEPDMRKPF